MTTSYRGRFAPSPTGLLHFGSLVAAVGSYLQARSQGGQWFVRIEDLDPPREVPGAADDILRTLEVFGFEWDGEVMYQSRRHAAYGAALEKLRHAGTLYACSCTRREIADSSVHGIEGPVYPGTCRAGVQPGRNARAWRVRVDGAVVEFDDLLQGRQRSALATDIGDFVIKRADGFFAYQLAVVVDDAEQGITEVVRGADLLHSTPRQIHLQRLLGLPTPRYLHLPVVLNEQGEKLSKQTFAAPVDRANPLPVLRHAVELLGQTPPDRDIAGLADFWGWTIQNWSLAALPQQPNVNLVANIN